MSGPRYQRERDLSLARAAASFVRELQPRFLILHFLAWLGYRLYLLGQDQGQGSAWDLAMIALVLAAHPFIEWLIHVAILHHRPRTVAGLRWDYHAARYHRLHHRDPWDLRFVLMPLPAMIFGLSAGAVGLWLVTPTTGSWATAMVVVAGAALAYEWVHFLIHTSYRPSGAFYRRLWRLHRLHHYKNENYWLGVTHHVADRVLGTYPDPDEVPASKTARTLGLEESLGDSAGHHQ